MGGNSFAPMRKITVFLYEKFDRVAGRWVTSERYATERAIYDMGGVAIRSTAIEVGIAHLDADGFLWATPLDRAS
jgi:hypothetical protein